MKSLVAAFGTEGWKEAVCSYVFEKFSSLTGDVDIDTGTFQQLREQFKEASGLESSALDKALRFYLAALDEAELTYSPHFKARGVRSSARGPAAPRPRRARTAEKGEAGAVYNVKLAGSKGTKKV